MNKFAIYYSPILEEIILVGSATDMNICLFKDKSTEFRQKAELIESLNMCNYELIGYCDL
jgi:hypothetical protein